MLTLAEGKKLVNLARDSISSFFSKSRLNLSEYEKFSAKQGVFVTLTKRGDLRGCIGFPDPVKPLYKAIFEAARLAAFDDPRFPPLSEEELDEIRIEISVLTVPELIKAQKPEEYAKKIEIGKDGLIVRGASGSGLLLPQVFPEWNADAKKALEMTCEKAGMDNACWKDPKNKFYKFQAQIFNEGE